MNYILYQCCTLEVISYCKELTGESVAKQHRMVMGRMSVVVRKMKSTKADHRMKWKSKKEFC